MKKIIYDAVFLTLGMVLPFLTGQIKEIGDSLLPMHLAVMRCGRTLGSKHGLLVGAVLPIFRAICFAMPPLYPNAVWMSLELATYGFAIGFVYSKMPKNKVYSVYASLILSMVCGRIVWGIAKAFLLGISGKAFTITMFVSGGIIDAIPGIILQLILIPIVFKITTIVKSL